MRGAPNETGTAVSRGARLFSLKTRISARDLVVTAQEFSGQSSGADAVLERDLSVHNRVAIARRLLHAPPVAVREIVYRLHRLHCELLEVVDHDVRGHAFPDKTAVANSDRPAYLGGEPPMCLFQLHDLLVTHPVRQ